MVCVLKMGELRSRMGVEKKGAGHTQGINVQPRVERKGGIHKASTKGLEREATLGKDEAEPFKGEGTDATLG